MPCWTVFSASCTEFSWFLLSVAPVVTAPVAQGAAGLWCCPGARGAPCKGQLTDSDGPWALGACRRAACVQPASCLVQAGAKGVGAAGQPWYLSHPRWGRGLEGAGLGTEGGQKQWRKGGGWGFPAHVDYDLFLDRRLESTAVAADFVLQVKPHVRPHSASGCNGEQPGWHRSEQSLASETQQPPCCCCCGAARAGWGVTP